MMKVYQLTGKHISGEDWGFSPIFKTLAEAEAKREIEVKAYTWQGKCDWDFTIDEIEVLANI